MATTTELKKDLPPTTASECTRQLAVTLRKFGILEIVESLAVLQGFRAFQLCDEDQLDGAAEALSCKYLLYALAHKLPGSRRQVLEAKRDLTGWKPKPKTKGESHV